MLMPSLKEILNFISWRVAYPVLQFRIKGNLLDKLEALDSDQCCPLSEVSWIQMSTAVEMITSWKLLSLIKRSPPGKIVHKNPPTEKNTWKLENPKFLRKQLSFVNPHHLPCKTSSLEVNILYISFLVSTGWRRVRWFWNENTVLGRRVCPKTAVFRLDPSIWPQAGENKRQPDAGFSDSFTWFRWECSH
jgi:hypothetical protein